MGGNSSNLSYLSCVKDCDVVIYIYRPFRVTPVTASRMILPSYAF